MSKRYNISWNENQQKQLKRAVKNFNAKIDRLAKKNPREAGTLPEKVSLRELKNMINTRQDLQREVNALKRFSKRGAEQLTNPPPKFGNTELRLTKWEVDEMLKRTARVNKSRALKRAEIIETEMTSRGKELGYKRGQVAMGSLDKNQLEPIVPFTRTMNNEERRRKFRTLRNESQIGYWDKRDNILKEAYIKGLKQNYNPEDVKDIIEKIRTMPTNEFRKIFEQEGGTKVFEWVYPKRRSRGKAKGKGREISVDTQDSEYEGYKNALRSIWGVDTEER